MFVDYKQGKVDKKHGKASGNDRKVIPTQTPVMGGNPKPPKTKNAQTQTHTHNPIYHKTHQPHTVLTGGGGGKKRKQDVKTGITTQVKPNTGKTKEQAFVVDDAETTDMALNMDIPETIAGHPIQLTAQSRDSLITPNAWVEDTVITAWSNLVVAYATTRVRNVPSMLSDKLKRGQVPEKIFSKMDISQDTLVIPCIQAKHWSLAVHRPRDTYVEWYNSLKSYAIDTAPMERWVASRCLPTVVNRVIQCRTPQQINGDDCGVITCLAVLAVAKDRNMSEEWGAHIEEARWWIDKCLREGHIPDHDMFNKPHVDHTLIPPPPPIDAASATNAHHTADLQTPIVTTINAVSTPEYSQGPQLNNTEDLEERVEPGDEEDDDDLQLETFIIDVEKGKVVPKAPPPAMRALDRVDPVVTRSSARLPTHQQATGGEESRTCHICERHVYKAVWCKQCARPCHVGCAKMGRCDECFKIQAVKPAPNKAGTQKRVTQEPNDKVSVNTGTVLKDEYEDSPIEPPPERPRAGIHNRTRPKINQVHIHVNTKVSNSDFQDGRKGPCPTVTHAAQFLSMKVAETPQESMDMAWKGIGAAQRASHQRLLRLLQITMASHFDLLHLPVAMASIKVLVRVRAALKWSPVTMAKHAASLSGAMARLDQYMDGPQTPIRLSEFSVWTDFMKEVKRQERLHKGRVPVAAKWPEVKRIMDSLLDKGKRATAILLLLSWTHAARPGDVWRLLRQDLELTPTRVTITWRRGKVVTTRGPYTTFAVPGMYQQLLEEHINQVPHDKPIFEGVWRSQNFLKEVRMHNPALELKSLRRGALQALSEAGVSEEILMIFSGHASVDTLRRYLGYRPSEDVARRCEEAARLLIQ